MAASPTLTIGSTEHAAAQQLPELAAGFPDHRVRFRIDRGAQLRTALAEGRIDLALLLGPAGEPDARAVGQLELTWYAAPGWAPPAAGDPIPWWPSTHRAPSATARWRCRPRTGCRPR
ncbi:LysR substrate-binding domain-containing protein [Actinoplanes auranticolor]|uniref:LysR substrate-binding domain-containing protein n=1 Tax=Actinoplanes auranticolor TaxID=47988 RepID=A0A919VIK8_9ACTN|nr:LysR substrate-binding domain-containing protein [Actinoplanes auranticolor]GIM63998.1 hypothetical protein Aau02nite_07700 [Actinoplanes auranticolor]